MTISEDDERSQLTVNPQYLLFLSGLVLLQVINSFIIWLAPSPDSRQVAWLFLYLVSTALMIGFFVRLVRAPQKMHFLLRQHGWMNFLGSLPVPFIALLQVARIYLITRGMRREDLVQVKEALAAERASSTALFVAWVGILMLEASAMGVLYFESQSPEANILNGGDALWWGFVTVATVGYGDRYPVTGMGRVVGVLTMTLGVALFSVLTSFLTDWFRRARNRRLIGRKPAGESQAEVNLEASLNEIYRLLDEQEQAHRDALDGIRERLKEIDSQRK